MCIFGLIKSSNITRMARIVMSHPLFFSFHLCPEIKFWLCFKMFKLIYVGNFLVLYAIVTDSGEQM